VDPFAWGLIHSGEKRASIERHKCDDGTEFDGDFQFPLYAAPPAHGVDLGQLQRWSVDYAEDGMVIRKDRNGDLLKLADVQKLIDQRGGEG
jgi:hypothetical protein